MNAIERIAIEISEIAKAGASHISQNLIAVSSQERSQELLERTKDWYETIFNGWIVRATSKATLTKVVKRAAAIDLEIALKPRFVSWLVKNIPVDLDEYIKGLNEPE